MTQPVVPLLQQAHVLMWPDGMPASISPRDSVSLTGTVLTLVNAADRTEVQAALQATRDKLNEVIALLNAARS